MTHPSQIIGTTCSQLHGIGTALADAATRMAAIRELLPARGELIEEFNDLQATLVWIQNAYRDADDALIDAYYQLEHAERCEREGWQPIPLHISGNGTGA